MRLPYRAVSFRSVYMLGRCGGAVRRCGGAVAVQDGVRSLRVHACVKKKGRACVHACVRKKERVGEMCEGW